MTTVPLLLWTFNLWQIITEPTVYIFSKPSSSKTATVLHFGRDVWGFNPNIILYPVQYACVSIVSRDVFISSHW